MSWNHRIVKYANGDGYGLHEVFYDEVNESSAMTEKPVSFVGDTPADVKWSLRTALEDSEKYPVLDEATEFPGREK